MLSFILRYEAQISFGVIMVAVLLPLIAISVTA